MEAAAATMEAATAEGAVTAEAAAAEGRQMARAEDVSEAVRAAAVMVRAEEARARATDRAP